MPSNVQPDPLRVVGLDTLDAAARVVRRELKGADTSGANAVYHHALTVNVRGVDVRLDITLRGPDCRSHVYELDGPRPDDTMQPTGPTPEQMLAAHVAVARQAYEKVTQSDVGTASWAELLAQRAALRGTLGALLDAIEGCTR
ncbi:hypothetical protein [Yinghuangia sp. YIM S10712]|uniref:hypothetical protein n=1 Tax=Yinghuangia sp. YIM S10712 TaxID=3436930 RepID=UPI003F52F87F